MFVVGNKDVFAIQGELTDLTEGWVFGRIRFLFHGRTCGNWNDSVDLRACYSWLQSFSSESPNRFESGLLDIPSIEVFERLVSPVICRGTNECPPENYDRTFARFHISHIGMSSFDAVVMVLVENDVRQRCVWEENGALRDDFFESGLMQRTAHDFCIQLKIEAIAAGAGPAFPLAG